MSRIYYETGVEDPEILGSGSSFSNVVRVVAEADAFEAYRQCGRNYLTRVTLDSEAPRKIEWWDDEQKCFR